MKVGDRITVNDRKLKTHSFNGEITSIETTIENVKIYNVLIELENVKGQRVGKRNVTLQDHQFDKELKKRKKKDV